MASRKRVGLALGGGVVRGMAHIGVLAALETAGIQVDVVAGSSVGSIIGAGFCAGLSVEELKALAGQMSWFRLVRLVWPARGFASFAPMERWLIKNYGDTTFDQLKIPFAAVTTDLQTGDSVVLFQGRLAPALCASCSVAGLAVPVEMDGRLLCDGNFTNSVPVSVARDMGADYVIGVDIFQHAIRRRLGALGYGLAGLELLIQRSGGGMHMADCLISPDLSGATYLRFSQREKMYELGWKAAQSQVGKILRDLS
jgi:NTE family protein